MGLLALGLKVDGIGEPLVEQSNDLRPGVLRQIVPGRIEPWLIEPGLARFPGAVGSLPGGCDGTGHELLLVMSASLRRKPEASSIDHFHDTNNNASTTARRSSDSAMPRSFTPRARTRRVLAS